MVGVSVIEGDPSKPLISNIRVLSEMDDAAVIYFHLNEKPGDRVNISGNEITFFRETRLHAEVIVDGLPFAGDRFISFGEAARYEYFATFVRNSEGRNVYIGEERDGE